MTGETFLFANWLRRQPDNVFGDENAICIDGPFGTRGTWSDLSSAWRLTAFIVEYEDTALPDAGNKSEWRFSALDIPPPGGDSQAARDRLGRIYVPLGKDPATELARKEVVRFEEATRSWQLVAELNVEARLVLLDQLVLEQQRLLLVLDRDGVDVGEEAIEEADERPRICPREVRAHAAAQVHRLADVDDLRVVPLHQVHARRLRQVGELLFEILVHG